MKKFIHHRAYWLGLLISGHFCSDFYATILPALLPFLISNLHLSLTAGGILVMLNSAAANIAQPFVGYYADKSGHTWLILTGLIISAVFICSAGLITNYPLLVLCLILSGLGVALFHPLGSSLANKIAVEHKRSLWMSLFIGGGNFGMAIAPAVATFLLVHYSQASLLWLIVPSILVTWFLYSSHIHGLNIITKPHMLTTTTKWYKSTTLWQLNFIMSMRSWTQSALTTFLPIMIAAHGSSTLVAGNMLTAFLLGGATGGLFGGIIGDKFGAKRCIIGALVLSLPFTWCFVSTTEVNIFTWLTLLLSGACLQSTMPSSIVWAQAAIPENKALASGMMLGLSCGLGGIGTAITGAIGDSFGIQYALMLTIVPLALSIPITLFTKQIDS